MPPKKDGVKDPGMRDVHDITYSVKDLAEIWDISEDAARKRIRRENIPTHKPKKGRKIQVLHSEWIAHIRQSPCSMPGLVY